MTKSDSPKISEDDPAPRTRIQVTPTITLHPDEIQERFVRASGPGGQNVNKVSTAVELRFDVKNSPSLPEMPTAIYSSGATTLPVWPTW